MSVTAKIKIEVSGEQVDAQDLGTARLPFALSVALALANGTSSGQADRAFLKTYSIAGSATQSVDLAGTLVDYRGVTVTFAEVIAVVVRSRAANVNKVNVLAPASNGLAGLFLALGDGVQLPPGFTFAWAGDLDGAAVVAGTADLLSIVNAAAGAAVVVDVAVIGRSV